MKNFSIALCFLLPLHLFAQITGRVVSANEQPIPFASITIKGSSVGVTTDSTGRFALKTNRPLPLTLLISSAGFEKLNRYAANLKFAVSPEQDSLLAPAAGIRHPVYFDLLSLMN